MPGVEVDGFLADSVVVAEGKLYVQGAGWNRIIASSFPTAHDRIGLGLIFRVPPAAGGSHRFDLRLEDGEGNQVGLGPTGRLGGAFDTGSVREGDEHLVPIAINLNGMAFQREADYRFVVSVDGTDLKTLRFRVEPRAAETPPVTGGGGYL